jgi:acyl-CoA oxidase
MINLKQKSKENQMQVYSPGIISVLPLFYIGWSDSVLSPTELSEIRNIIQKMEFLSTDEKDLLVSWTNPKSPPTEEIFNSWIHQLASHAYELDLSERNDLVSLGIELAKKTTGNEHIIHWESEKTRASINNLQRALRVDSQLSKLAFYSKINRNKANEIETETTFDSKKLGKILDGKHHELKNKVKALISEKSFQVPVNLRDKDELREVILKQTILLAEQGLGAYAYPQAFGGENSPAGSSAIFEAMALGNISLLIKFGVQFGLFGGAVYQLGTQYHHNTYLEPTGSAALLGCFAMTETGHGSNVKDLETTASYNHDNQTITVNSPTYTSGKEYIGNALHSTMATVFVQLIVKGENHGIHCVLVPLRDVNHQELPGIKVEDCGYKIGLNGVDNGRIWFNQVEVPVKNLLNKHGGIDENGNYYSSIDKPSKRFFTMLGALVGGRVSVAAGANSAAKKALNIAINYALKRRQFTSIDENIETLILDYPTHQERLFPLLAKSYALTFALERLREKWAENYGQSDQREVEAMAAGLKSYASWHATKAIQTCRETCGGKGYLSENELGDLKADTEIFTTFEGDNTVLMQLVAKALLTDFKQDFNEGGYLAIARYVLKRVSNTLASQNPITTRNTNAEHILSDDFMRSAFEFREEKLLFGLSDRMQSFMKKKLNPNEIFLRVQTHMVLLANAHIEHLIYKEFSKTIENITLKNEKEAIDLMLQTYALNAIYEDRGWYLENDFISADKSKAIRKILTSLYRQIRPKAKLYVDAFDIPEVLLKAKIAVNERVMK